MPEFHLRVWAEQVLFDCRDYTIDAATLEDAVALLDELQEEADSEGQSRRNPAVEAWRGGNRVRGLDPAEIVSGDQGITLIDEAGVRVRDLVGVPTGCTQLGVPIDEEVTRAAAIRDATPPDLDLAAQHQREQEALTGLETDVGFV